MPVIFASQSLTPATPVTRTVKVFTDLIEEGSTADLAFIIQTAAAGIVANTEIDSMLLTMIDEETHALVVAAREDQDVLGGAKTGQNNVTVSTTSAVVFSLQAVDTVVVDPTKTKKIEYHRAVFTITTTIAAVTEIAKYEVRFPVRPTFLAQSVT